ncbi:methyl-accepting chemotaxis protein [Geomobilimonas luticola]|uniref:HAMP domain-containing protein n=1 Tax=Geomobilimonas luticola TaxID=1114878 RepID=A0ABS5SF83_9BACT|nr:HAMP domain-containing methyl-accepting chemotaxis protein [Geomobilimonas luticola]MBT0654025.1 HAMP domain-containing protein [Geomobilimonas luticola]
MKGLKLGQRLTGSFMILALIVAITGAFGAFSMNRVGDRIQDLLKNLAGQQKLVLLMGATQKACQVSLLQAAMETDAAAYEDHAEDYRMLRDQFRSQCGIILKGNAKMGISSASPGSDIEKRAQAALKGWDAFDKVAEELLSVKAESFKGVNGVDRLRQLIDDKLSVVSDDAKLAVDELLVAVGSRMTTANGEVKAIQRSAGITIAVVIVLAIVVAAGFGMSTSRHIIGRLDKVAGALRRGSQGDLTSRLAIDSSDELGKLADDYNVMVQKLSEMVGKVDASAADLAGISDNLSHASKQVVNAAQLQVEGVSHTSSAMTQINTSVKGVAEGVDALSQSAAESSSSILEMAASIEEVALNMENLTQSVEEVSASIGEISISIKEVGNGVVSLMEASTTTASSVMQMDSSIKQVERNAMETAAISDEVRQDAENGKKTVEATIAGIDAIRTSSRITFDVITTLSGRTEDIGAILSVIDEVAEQTNLLALNAAIIAAQAGEHGKGFAVVADEIKELSERTSSSTREIAALIKAVQDETRRAVEAINQAETSIAEGEDLSLRSGEALNKILEGVIRSSAQMAEIARATVEQAKGSHIIRDAMEQVSEMVGQIAKATKEQGMGSGMIMGAVERMKDLTAQVRSSTREQSKVGNFIAKSTEDITDMIRQIKIACDEQRRGSEQVVVAVEDIQQSTNINVEATRIMNEAVENLFRQTEILRQEMASFKVRESA